MRPSPTKPKVFLVLFAVFSFMFLHVPVPGYFGGTVCVPLSAADHDQSALILYYFKVRKSIRFNDHLRPEEVKTYRYTSCKQHEELLEYIRLFVASRVRGPQMI